jgi:thiol-disulfide isomerase/thioredoxin
VISAKRRAVVPVAAVGAGLLLMGVLLSVFLGGSGQAGGITYLDGSTAVLYAPGHRPKAPDFTATTLTGSALRFSSYLGDVVVVNFWGSWCVPCRAEAPTLAVVSEQYAARGVRFLGVDVNDSSASALAFDHDFGIAYPSVSDPGYVVTLDFSSAVPIAGTPTTLVIDKTGHIAGAIFAGASYSELTTILNRVMRASA